MDEQRSATLPADPTTGGQIYTTKQVAKMLQVSQRAIELWIRAGTLTAVRYGTRLRIRQADLAQFGEVVTPRPAPSTPPEAE